MSAKIESVIWANVYLNWSDESFGFGQLSFDFDRDTGEITCNNECINRERFVPF